MFLLSAIVNQFQYADTLGLIPDNTAHIGLFLVKTTYLIFNNSVIGAVLLIDNVAGTRVGTHREDTHVWE